MRVLKLIVFIIFFLAVGSNSRAQTPQKFIEFGFSTNSYKGDLNHSYTQWANGYHVGILFNRKKTLNGHFQLMIGNSVAQNPDYVFDDGSNPQPNPSKYVKIKLINLNYDLRLHVYKKNNVMVYLYQGIGITRFDPRDSENKKLSDQLNTRALNETFSNVTICLLNGIGAAYVFKPGFGAGFQVGWLNTMTDYLDNISQWGDRAKNDNILLYKLTFYIPLNKKETVIANPTLSE